MTEGLLPDAVVSREPGGGKIILVVLDGVGGLPHPETGRTELETARTPNLDALASRSSLGMLTPVAPGITPGSGPGHLALFGYDPVRYRIGRGALSALGVGFDLRPGDVAVRLNLATFDPGGRVADRRAGRPPDGEGRRIIEKLRAGLPRPEGVAVFLHHGKEHRAALILRGRRLAANVTDSDPQDTGLPPKPVTALDAASKRAAAIVETLLGDARRTLADEPVINGVLARGCAMYEEWPSVEDRFGLKAFAFARYPMYRGVARLVGMTVPGIPESDEAAVSSLEGRFEEADLAFIHFKAPDACGEDGDFDAKVRAIEAADALLPRIAALAPDVLIVTGDHSTPAALRAHSWHSVPVLIASPWTRPTARTFGESSCRGGDLGGLEGRHLMTLALAHAGRIEKFGA